MNHAEDDAYVLDELSDEEQGKSSSEDELDLLLHGTPDQKRKFIRECLTGESESSSDDEFEKEMENELSSTMKVLEGSWNLPGTDASTSSSTASADTKQQYYEDIYFDSDSDEEATQDKKQAQKRRHKVQTNDDLLYDPLEDDRNQKWIDAKRRYRFVQNDMQTRAKHTEQPMSTSDAILNCPACMTMLCLDCQRHETYKTQYRAMFVLNCSIDRTEALKFSHEAKSDMVRRRLGPRYQTLPQKRNCIIL